MRSIKFILLFSILFLQGCFVQSLEPFYTPETKFEDVNFKGEWFPLDSTTQQTGDRAWDFSATEILTYNEKGVPATLEAKYFKIQDELFVDITASKIKDESFTEGVVNEWWNNNVVAVHSLFKVKFLNDRLMFMMLDYDWLKKKMKNKRNSLTFSQSSNIYTASSQDWVSFLKKYAKDPQAFDEKHAFQFLKNKK